MTTSNKARSASTWQLVQVWRCERCHRDMLGLSMLGAVALANGDDLDSFTLTTVAQDGYHLNAPCPHCRGAVEILYWHAAITAGGHVVGISTRPVSVSGRSWSVALN